MRSGPDETSARSHRRFRGDLRLEGGASRPGKYAPGDGTAVAVFFLGCNRSGCEGDRIFYGRSAIAGLDQEAAIYTGLARLLERVRHWRATEVYEDEEPVSVFHTKEMAWCASFQLGSFRECRERFDCGVLPRCAVCPLFDAERAIRAGFRAEPAPGEGVQIGFGQDEFWIGAEPDFTNVTGLDFLFNPDVVAGLGGQIPDWMDLSGLVPDFPPEEWPEPADG